MNHAEVSAIGQRTRIVRGERFKAALRSAARALKNHRNYQAVPWQGAWAVRRSGAARCTLTGMSRENAWREARRLARRKGVSAYLFNAHCRVEEKA